MIYCPWWRRNVQTVIKITGHAREISSSNAINKRVISRSMLVRNENEDKTQPLVIIFGYSEGKMKSLIPYSTVYERKNFTTLCVTTFTINSVIGIDTKSKKISDKVYDVIKELIKDNRQRPIYFHIMCQGVALYYNLIRNDDFIESLGPNVKGTIFDSVVFAFGIDHIKIVQKAILETPDIPYIVGKILGNIFLVAAHIAGKWKGEKVVNEIMPTIENSRLLSPQLVLFSKADVVAPYEKTLDFINKRKNLGIDITYQLWEKSKHVMHFQTHRREYIRLVNGFIEKCSKLES